MIEMKGISDFGSTCFVRQATNRHLAGSSNIIVCPFTVRILCIYVECSCCESLITDCDCCGLVSNCAGTLGPEKNSAALFFEHC